MGSSLPARGSDSVVTIPTDGRFGGELGPSRLRGRVVDTVRDLMAEGVQAGPATGAVLLRVDLGRDRIGEHPCAGLALDQHGDTGHVRVQRVTSQLRHFGERLAEGAVADKEP